MTQLVLVASAQAALARCSRGLNSPTRSQSTCLSLGAGNSVVAGAALEIDAESALEVVDDVRPTAGGYLGYAHTGNRWAHRMVSIHS